MDKGYVLMKPSDSITKLSNDVFNHLNANKNLLDSPDGDLINVKTFSSRGQFIEQLISMQAGIEAISKQLSDSIKIAKSAHEKDLLTLGAILVGAGVSTPHLISPVVSSPSEIPEPIEANDSANWITVTKKTPKNPTRSPKTYVQSLCSTRDDNIQSDITSKVVAITETKSLPAIVVQDFDSVKSDGNLYYVEPSDHFAIRIMGNLFHGNIGIVYTDEKLPEKIKDCKYPGRCRKGGGCDYYHDPVKFSGSRDHRNHIAGSFLYAPPDASYKNRSRNRCFGSRTYLDTDLVALQPDDISRFHDQVFHDILCALISCRYNPQTTQ